MKKDDEGKDRRKRFEIDFVANQGSKRYYIQAAYAIPDETKWKQETNSFDKTHDSFKKLVIVADRYQKPKRNEKGYVTMGLTEFLLDPNSLEA
ncbi:ATP-binding protein [Sphaerochaeta halotolerans]|uniref:ATP-binding protein n=1 Tax=Sphaerochaeta halotolerans TaxID=2293840 RepID=UPI0013697D4B|nr:ATP-binding protein [Sphaerochaeta halotolerans]MXI87001.1 ATP-binding protein [Sphaerochaeta halotolerans]